jgi:glycosyltransferase involved in cell wall biosynthesis
MRGKEPDVSLVMPCYNEEVAIRVTAPELAHTFAREGVALQLVLVDNGSTDRTGAVIDELLKEGYPIKKVAFEKNQGYGGGILAGLRQCEAPVIGYLCADGQVSAEDTLMSYRLIRGREDRMLTKVRRRFRKDSWKRKIVSIIYNGLMQVLYGGLGAIDINGSPKIFSRETFEAMDIVSTDWFLDPEIIIKAKYLGLRTIEVDVEGHARKGGASNVNVNTCVEFVGNIVRYRFGNSLLAWRRKIDKARILRRDDRSSPFPGGDDRTRPVVDIPAEEAFLLPKGVRIITQNRYEDSRGFLQKVLTASQCNGNSPRGEVYVTSARPGESKGNHYHLNMGEWFTVIQGEGSLDIYDPKTDKRVSIPLGISKPRTVYVPAGLAHSVANKSRDMLICVAWAEKEHDPQDVHPLVIPG